MPLILQKFALLLKPDVIDVHQITIFLRYLLYNVLHSQFLGYFDS